MRYFIDTEFRDDGQVIDLISIGAVAEDGREFYAVSTEARLDRASDWVRENVLPKLPPYGPLWAPRSTIAASLSMFFAGIDLRGALPRYPTNSTHLDLLRGAPKAEVWGYYSAYDWVAVCQLYGRLFQCPKHFPKMCLDLKQLSIAKGLPKGAPLPKPEGAHDALVDARWNRDLYNLLNESTSK